MADLKISQLPAASTPLGGTEVLPLVQGGETKKVTVNELRSTAVTGVTATTPVVSSGGLTPNISMPAATTSVSGYLTSTDWNTFNNKQAAGAVTSVSGTTGRITSTGGTTPVIDLASGVATPGTTGSALLVPVVTVDTYGRVTSVTTAANPQGTVTSVTGTAPVVSSGGATPAISMAAASTSANGYLTSTDWNTFNGKYSVGGALGTPASGTATNLTGLPLTTGVTGLLPVANGGTGTATPALVAGSNVTITGTWPNQTIASTGGTGTVTSVATGTGLTGGPITTSGTISLANTAVTAGTYTAANITVDAQGRITAAANGSGGGGGTVTSVAATVPAFLSVTGSPITTAGTLAISYSGTALPVANGGTGVTTSTGSGNNVLSTSPTLVTPILGTPTSGTLTNATGLPLTTGVTGTLATTNGGTGLTSFTANGVVYASSTSALATGSALTFDGAGNLTATGAAGAAGGEIDLKLVDSTSGRLVQLIRTGATFSYAGVAGAEAALYTASNNLNLVADGGSIKFNVGTLGSASEQMRLTSTGLGIGTSSPTEKLHVAGALRVTGAQTTAGTGVYLDQTSGTGGVSVYGPDNSTQGTFRVYTATANGGTGSTKLTIDSSGNLGLGVTPSAWDSGWKAIDVSTVSSYTGSATGTDIWNNARVTGATPIYKTTAAASFYRQSAGVHYWFNAPSGTAGNAITFTQALTLNANGALVLQGGTTSASGVGVAFPATQSASTDANTLDDYEEGTWTPNDQSGASLSLTTSNARYTKIGNMVYCSATITYPSTASGASARIGGLPFTSIASSVYGGYLRYTDCGVNLTIAQIASAANFEFYNSVGSVATNVSLSTKRVDVNLMYQV